MNHEEADSQDYLSSMCCGYSSAGCVKRHRCSCFTCAYHIHYQAKIWLGSSTGKQQFIIEVLHYVGFDIANVFLQFHAITTFNTTSFKYRRGKRAALKKLMMNKSFCKLLEKLGQQTSLSDSAKSDIFHLALSYLTAWLTLSQQQKLIFSIWLFHI